MNNGVLIWGEAHATHKHTQHTRKNINRTHSITQRKFHVIHKCT